MLCCAGSDAIWRRLMQLQQKNVEISDLEISWSCKTFFSPSLIHFLNVPMVHWVHQTWHQSKTKAKTGTCQRNWIPFWSKMGFFTRFFALMIIIFVMFPCFFSISPDFLADFCSPMCLSLQSWRPWRPLRRGQERPPPRAAALPPCGSEERRAQETSVRWPGASK